MLHSSVGMTVDPNLVKIQKLPREDAFLKRIVIDTNFLPKSTQSLEDFQIQ